MANEFKVKNGLITPSVTATGIVSGSELTSTLASGDEGGQINLAKPPNATTNGGVTIDAYQNRVRIFEQGGDARGVYIDLTAAAAGVGTNLLSGGSGSMVYPGSGIAVSTGSAWGTSLTAPTGTIVGTSDTQNLSNKTFTDNPTFSGGTASGVAYLNGSKVLTSGTALIFDGSNLGVGVTPSSRLQISRGTSNTAPTTITKANAYLGVGGSEYNTNSYRLIGFGYTQSQAQYPAYIGFQETNSVNATLGDLIFFTRSVTTDTAPSERVRITSSGNLQVAGLTASKAVFTDASKNLTSTGTLGVDQGGTGAATLTGVLKGNGTSAFTAATAGTDYLAPPSGTSILKANSGGALANAVAGTDYLVPPSGTSILKANSGGALANAVAGTDYIGPDGTGATGTWSISVTGNAGTVTNGLYSTGSYADPTWITSLTGSKISGNISGNAANVTGTIAVANGGTGQTTYTDGQLLIGNSTGNTLNKATLTAGSGISITNAAGSITIAATASGSSAWSVKTSNYTAVAGDKLLTNSSGGTFTITLPATPSTGNSVIIADANDWSTTSITVARNGSTIEGLSEDLTLNVKGVSVEFVYDGSTWEVFATAITGATAISTGKAIAMAMVFSGVN